MSKTRIATVWLDGCSGCHMSLLDMDERILTLANSIELTYGPLVDAQSFPKQVDVCLVEGAVSSQEDLEMIQKVRQRSKLLVALGDCAVTSNVPAMRNPIPVKQLLSRVYGSEGGSTPNIGVPPLLRHSVPLHKVVKVDLHVPGCPPSAEAIFTVLTELLAGRVPDVSAVAKFG
jgi:NAD-reducing hydrogenase small subunit